MLKTLIKLQLTGFLSSLGGKGKRGRGKTVLLAFLFLYVAAAFIFLMGMTFSMLAGPLNEAGLGWFYFTMYAILSFAMMFIMTVFMTQSQLYDAKDNALLLSMPIPAKYIVGSRVLTLVIENALYGLITAIPAIVVWLMHARMTAMGVVSFVVIALALPFFSFAISGIFGYLLHLVLAHVRNKTLIGTVFSVAFLGVYFVVMARLNYYMQELAAKSVLLAEKLSGVAPLFWIGAAVSEGNVLYLLGVLAIVVVVFLAVYAFLSKTFFKSAINSKSAAKVRYERREMRVSSPLSALIRKETARLTSSTTYLLNAGLGVLFLVVAAVALVVKRRDVLDALDTLAILFAGAGAEKIEGFFGLAFIAGICLMESMCIFSAPSVSLEGKSVWIPKSMPVEAKTVLLSKVLTHALISVPAGIIASIAVAAMIPMGAAMRVLVFIVPLAFTCLIAAAGVSVNIIFPRLDWTSEAQVVKQGASITISMFGGMIMVIGPALLYAFVLSDKLAAELYALLCAVVYAGAAAALTLWLTKGGARRFNEL